MANIAVEKKPIGGLDTDTNLQDVAPLDYIDAKNCQNIDKYERNNNYEIFPLGGNEYKFFLPTVQLQRKVIRIFIEKGQEPSVLPAGAICDIELFTQNGVSIGVINITTTNSPTLFDFAAQIVSQAAAFTPTFILGANDVIVSGISDTYYGYIDVVFQQFFADELPEDYYINITGSTPYSFTTQAESLSRDVTGKLNVVGRFNLANDLFLWATTVRNTEFGNISISSVTNIATTAQNANIEIITSTPHGLFTGQQVLIVDSGSATGVWLVVVIDDFTIQLVNSAYQAYSVPTFSVLKKYVSGYGSILYANRDLKGDWVSPISNQAAAIPLIGAKSLNFSTLNGVDAVVKKNNFQAKFKFGDNRNPYRLLVYTGGYTIDGFIEDPITGKKGYSYDSLDTASKLLIGDTSLIISNVQEVIGAGQLSTYNYVFYARLINDDFTKTPFSPPSNPFSLIKQDTSDVTQANILAFNGDVSQTSTTKALKINVENIPKGAYKYLEIAVIEYIEGSYQGYTLEKILLSPFQIDAEILFSSTKNVGVLDIIDLNRLYINIQRGLNILDIENRTVISNVRLGVDPDLTAVASAVVISVKKKSLQKKQTLSGTNPLEFGEYELPDNILRYTGYHLWDTVRLGVRYKIKGSNWTKVYHVKDQNIYQGLIDGGLDYSLTDTVNTFSYYLEATNHDLDYLVNGVKLRDLIEDFQWVRVEVNSEVLASGIMVISDDPISATFDAYPKYDGSAPNISTANRRIVYFYSPDLNVTNRVNIEWKAGDKIINLGNANLENTFLPSGSPDGEIYELDGQLRNAIQEIEVLDLINFFDKASPAVFPLNPTIFITLEDAQTANSDWYNCLALYLDSDAIGLTFNPDLGVYNCIYIRPSVSLYPLDVTQSVYQPIWGVATDIDTDTLATTYDIFGGDTFTMKRYLKLRNKSISVDNAAAFGFYSQSTRNTQIARYIFPALDLLTPFTTVDAAAFWYLLAGIADESNLVVYDTTFDIINLINSYAPFNQFVVEQQESIATIYWSLQALEDSEQNNDRYFLPLNQRAIDATAGEIIHMIKSNDLLYTLQPLRTERQYFDNTQMLKSVTSTEILLGTGQVMALKGDFKSFYGCSNKWAVQYGSTQGGRSYFFYPDAINRKFVRVGDDGTKVISDSQSIFTWAMKGLLFAGNQLTPFDNYGLHTGWDEKSSQIYFTSRTFRKIKGEWDIYGEYEVGELVTNGYFYGLNDAPVIYRCIQYNFASAESEPQTGVDWESYWEIIENTIDNYNFWTLVWSEKENKFKWWVSPRPKTWIGYKETMLSPSPIDENLIFEHTELGAEAHWYCRDMDMNVVGVVSGNTLDTNDSGFRILENGFYRILEDGVSKRLITSASTNSIPTQSTWGETIWYLVDSNGVQYEIVSVIDGIITVIGDLPPDETEFSVTTCVFEEPYITNVVNENKGNKARFVFTKYNSTKEPKRVEYTTNQHKSYLDKAEFENVDEYYESPVKVDTTNSPNDNETDASMLFGKYLIVKTYLGANNQQKLNNFVMKIREMNPKINK
tara:strand:+ start:12543 stop:17141 length:4599 start_codon:yes stop_codon:yes gene_type:complete